MLILARSKNEKVIIADQRTGSIICEVMVCEIERGKVKIGFAADSEIAVHRQEIYLQIYGNKRDGE